MSEPSNGNDKMDPGVASMSRNIILKTPPQALSTDSNNSLVSAPRLTP